MSTLAETYLKPSQISKIDISAKIINGNKPLTIFAKSPIPNVYDRVPNTSLTCVSNWRHTVTKKKENMKVK